MPIGVFIIQYQTVAINRECGELYPVMNSITSQKTIIKYNPLLIFIVFTKVK